MHRPGLASLLLTALALLVLLPVLVVGLIEPSAFGTTPFSDAKVSSPQQIPGKVCVCVWAGWMNYWTIDRLIDWLID